MKVTASENYWHGFDCPLRDCDRHYCDDHRLLWRDCDTAKKGYDDDYADGRPHYIWALGGCPECEADGRKKTHYRRMLKSHPDDAVCPVCFGMDRRADKIAVHLMDDHKWDLAHATLWLRDETERIGGDK